MAIKKKMIYYLEEAISEPVNKFLIFSSWENVHFNSAFKFHTLFLMMHKQGSLLPQYKT